MDRCAGCDLVVNAVSLHPRQWGAWTLTSGMIHALAGRHGDRVGVLAQPDTMLALRDAGFLGGARPLPVGGGLPTAVGEDLSAARYRLAPSVQLVINSNNRHLVTFGGRQVSLLQNALALPSVQAEFRREMPWARHRGRLLTARVRWTAARSQVVVPTRWLARRVHRDLAPPKGIQAATYGYSVAVFSRRLGLPAQPQSLARQGPSVAIGSAHRYKRLEDAVAAFAGAVQIAPALRDTGLLVVGAPQTSALAGRLATLSAHLNVADCVEVVGRVHATELGQMYGRAPFVVVPSVVESLGLPVLESWHCGSVPIVRSGGAMAEVIGGAGLTFHSATELAERMVQAASLGMAQRGQVLRRGQQRLKTYDWVRALDGLAA